MPGPQANPDLPPVQERNKNAQTKYYYKKEADKEHDQSWYIQRKRVYDRMRKTGKLPQARTIAKYGIVIENGKVLVPDDLKKPKVVIDWVPAREPLVVRARLEDPDPVVRPVQQGTITTAVSNEYLDKYYTLGTDKDSETRKAKDSWVAKYKGVGKFLKKVGVLKDVATGDMAEALNQYEKVIDYINNMKISVGDNIGKPVGPGTRNERLKVILVHLDNNPNLKAKVSKEAYKAYREAQQDVSMAAGERTANARDEKCDVPTGRGRNVYMDAASSFITLQLKSTDAAAMSLDGSAYSLLNRLDVLSGGQILETISDYGHTVNTLLDLNMAGSDAAVSGSVALGTVYAASTNNDKTGAGLAIGSGTAQFQDFSLPIALSGILGPACSKYIPVGIMSDLRAEFTVEQAALGVVCASATPAWTIQNFTLNLQFVELDPQVAEQIHAANNGVYRISTEGWRTYSTVGASGRASDSVLVPARFSSARTLATYRDNAQAVAGSYWTAHRVNPYYHASQKCSIQYAVGSSLVPQSPIQFGTSEAYTMMLQAFHSLGNAAHNNRCSLTNWNQTAYSGTAGSMGTFAIAVNLDSMMFKSKDLSVGMNTLTSPVFLQGTFPTAPTIAHRITNMVHYDALLEISDQGTTIRF